MEGLGKITFIFTGILLIIFGECMEKFKLAIEWLLLNKEALAVVVLALITFAETVVRLTPTKSDDGAVERVGKIVKKIFDFCKIPNNTVK